MVPASKPKDTEADDEQARADLNLVLPLDQNEQQREGKQHDEHREQMAGSERPKRGQERARISFHQSGRNRERPAHSRVYAVVKAARHDNQPEPDGRPIRSAQIQADG
jgi:hypothetical protein